MPRVKNFRWNIFANVWKFAKLKTRENLVLYGSLALPLVVHEQLSNAVSSLSLRAHIHNSSKWCLSLVSLYSIHVNRCSYVHVHEGWEGQKPFTPGVGLFQEIGTLHYWKLASFQSLVYTAYLYSQLCRQGQTGGRHCCQGETWSCWWPVQWTPPDARSEACWVPWWCEGSPGQHLWSGVSALSQALATHEALPLPHPKNGYYFIH